MEHWQAAREQQTLPLATVATVVTYQTDVADPV